jgi:hypothetical protein
MFKLHLDSHDSTAKKQHSRIINRSTREAAEGALVALNELRGRDPFVYVALVRELVFGDAARTSTELPATIRELAEFMRLLRQRTYDLKLEAVNASIPADAEVV